MEAVVEQRCTDQPQKALVSFYKLEDAPSADKPDNFLQKKETAIGYQLHSLTPVRANQEICSQREREEVALRSSECYQTQSMERRRILQVEWKLVGLAPVVAHCWRLHAIGLMTFRFV